MITPLSGFPTAIPGCFIISSTVGSSLVTPIVSGATRSVYIPLSFISAYAGLLIIGSRKFAKKSEGCITVQDPSPRPQPPTRLPS
ncbi:hypothetical protein K449DRAFT_429877 [Hypoxylon sp. EC38]|nr:hypothetical protein K449DRAFT_429877 [Hypoxylon sp. EC38]